MTPRRIIYSILGIAAGITLGLLYRFHNHPTVVNGGASAAQGSVATVMLVPGSAGTSDASTGLPSNQALPISETLVAPNGSVQLRVADTDAERQLGLSNFPTLPSGQGMLFVFQSAAIYPFWMKDMNVPLDMVWMKKLASNQYQVVTIAQDALPSSYPNTFSNTLAADTVLEINAFSAQTLGIARGGIVTIVPNSQPKKQ